MSSSNPLRYKRYAKLHDMSFRSTLVRPRYGFNHMKEQENASPANPTSRKNAMRSSTSLPLVWLTLQIPRIKIPSTPLRRHPIPQQPHQLLQTSPVHPQQSQPDILPWWGPLPTRPPQIQQLQTQPIQALIPLLLLSGNQNLKFKRSKTKPVHQFPQKLMTLSSNLSLFPTTPTPSTKTTPSNTVSFKTKLTQPHPMFPLQLSSPKVKRKTPPSFPRNALPSHLTTIPPPKRAKTAKKTKNTSHSAKNAFQSSLPPTQKQNT